MLTIVSHCRACGNTIEQKIKGKSDSDLTMRRLTNASKRASQLFSKLFYSTPCGVFHPIETKLKRGEQ